MTEKLDKVDLQILRTLQENARLTTKDTSRSTLPCWMPTN